MPERVVVVTGASRGIGQAIAISQAGKNATVVGVARSEQGLAETGSRIEAAGGRFQGRTADLTRHESVKQLVSTVEGEFGGIDVLVNNAGSAPHDLMEDFDVTVFDDMLAINCGAVFHMTRAVWPIMIERGGGVIVNISSIAAKDPFRGFQAYGATKAWINALTRSLASEGITHNIRVYAVAPGAVDTHLLRANFPDFPKDQCLRPEDVAETVDWILDNRARYASGAVVYVQKHRDS